MKYKNSFLKIAFSLLAVIGLGYGVYYYVFNIWLPNYTNHDQFVEVPDLSKMNIKEAVNTLNNLELTYEIDSSQFDPNIKPFTVLDFYPHKDYKLKAGRRIFIKSNPRTYRPVEIPDLVGKSKRLALTQLGILELKLNNIIYEPDSAKDAVLKLVYNGKILKAGDLVPRFASVDLVLGRGLLSGISVVNLIDKTLEEAKLLIENNFFELGQIKYLGKGDNDPNARVVFQFPLNTDLYNQGQPIDLWLSTSPKDSLKNELKSLNFQYKNFEEDTISGGSYLKILDKTQPKPKIEKEKESESFDKAKEDIVLPDEIIIE